LFVHFQHEFGYNHILAKLISLASIMPGGLALLIVTLPPNATYCDSSLAEHLQRAMYAKHTVATQVVFVRFEDKQMI